MSNDIYFRTSLAGYNKNDVMRFIEKLNADQVNRVNDLNEQIRTSQLELKKSSAEAETLRRRCDELERTLSIRGKGDIDNAQKAQKYDEMQKNYADIMLDAESAAKEKIKSSEEQAKAIIDQANTYFEEQKKKLSESKKKILEQNKSILSSSLNEFSEVVQKLTGSLENTWNAIVEEDINE